MFTLSSPLINVNIFLAFLSHSLSAFAATFDLIHRSRNLLQVESLHSISEIDEQYKNEYKTDEIDQVRFKMFWRPSLGGLSNSMHLRFFKLILKSSCTL